MSILNLLFEFSIEYDIELIRKSHQRNKEKRVEDRPLPDDVKKKLGYK